MATFHVGQRVKRIGEGMFIPLGSEGTIISPVYDGLCQWRVAFDGLHEWNCVQENLAPLTDPKADEFIERIKKQVQFEKERLLLQMRHSPSDLPHE